MVKVAVLPSAKPPMCFIWEFTIKICIGNMTTTQWTGTYNDLAAALANVDESDFVGMEDYHFAPPPVLVSNTQTMGSTASSDDSEETKMSGPKPEFKRRNRPRDELQNLRATVRQLETRLAILRDQSGKVPEPTQKTDAVADKMWEGIAGRQLRELGRSERENARLRVMVEDQSRTIKSLERMVMKKRSKVTSIIQQPSPSDDVRDPIHDPELDKQIEEEVITMLNDIDRIANDPRFQVSLDNPLHITEVLEDAGDGLVVESLDGRLFPFDYQDTADALWTMWKSVPIDLVHGTAPDNLRFTDSTVWRIDAGELENLGASIQFHSKLIGRRRIEDNRVVMASILLVRPIKLDGTPLSGVHLRLRIWNIFRPINKSETTSFTSRQLYTQCTLERQDGSDCGDSLSGVSLLASFILHNSGPRFGTEQPGLRESVDQAIQGASSTG